VGADFLDNQPGPPPSKQSSTPIQKTFISLEKPRIYFPRISIFAARNSYFASGPPFPTIILAIPSITIIRFSVYRKHISRLFSLPPPGLFPKFDSFRFRHYERVRFVNRQNNFGLKPILPSSVHFSTPRVIVEI